MKNIINTSLFTNDFTPESVYILGLLWADGYTDKKSNRVSIECVKDDIEYFYPIFQTTGDFKLSERQRPNRRLQGTISKSSLELSTFLKENDYGDKSLSSPNKIISRIPKDQPCEYRLIEKLQGLRYRSIFNEYVKANYLILVTGS